MLTCMFTQLDRGEMIRNLFGITYFIFLEDVKNKMFTLVGQL
jgi:hypothetical protein